MKLILDILLSKLMRRKEYCELLPSIVSSLEDKNYLDLVLLIVLLIHLKFFKKSIPSAKSEGV